jgi:hypothetical protein
MRRILIFAGFFLSSLCTAAQQPMTLEEFLGAVRAYHPIAKQAAIGVEIARAEVTSARGAFDPVLQNNISRKELGGLLYYDHQLSEVRYRPGMV